MEQEKLNEQVENKINEILEQGITLDNIAMLGKLVDIHKDIANEDYWLKKKEECKMNYRMRSYDEGDYGRRGVPGTGRRYRGDYGRRGVPGTGRGRYRGEYVIDEMQEHYNNYNDASSDVYNGDYGAEDEMIKSVEGIMKNVYEIVGELSEADNPEVMHIIKKYTKKIEEMG